MRFYDIYKYSKYKWYLILLIVVIILDCFLFFTIINKEKTVMYKGNRLIYQDRSNRSSIFKDDDGNILTVKPINVDLDDELTIIDDDHCSYEIVYKESKMLYDNSKFMDMETIITLFDGSMYESTPISVDYYNEQSYELPSDVKLAYDVINIHRNPKGISGHLGDIILSIISIVIGFINLIYPEKVWKFEHMLDVKGGEPTDFAIINLKIVGVIFIFMPTIFLLFGNFIY
ncbi:MAG: DUF6199 family natural product biosynthesis protein [Peptostreptococcaceae bacterium]